MKIDGKKIAQEIFEDLKVKVQKLQEKVIVPHLTIILVGNDPASIAYVNQKKKKAEEIGARATVLNYESGIRNQELLEKIEELNADPEVHGIIVQRPLPDIIDSEQINQAVESKKDVDAFRKDSPYPMPLAQAVLKILDFIRCHLDQGDTLTEWLKSKTIVVIGKGETGGGPVISLLRKMGVEPQIIDSKTANSELITMNADIIISTVGKPSILKADELKKGVILIGVGMHKGDDGKLHGDYNEKEIQDVASFYTPIPGGVGPVNVAMLLENIVEAATH